MIQDMNKVPRCTVYESSFCTSKEVYNKRL